MAAPIVIVNEDRQAQSFSIWEEPGGQLGPFIIEGSKAKAYTPGRKVTAFAVVSGSFVQRGRVGETKQVVLPALTETKEVKAGVPDPACATCPTPAQPAVLLGAFDRFGALGAANLVVSAGVTTVGTAARAADAGAPTVTAVPGVNLIVFPPGAVRAGADPYVTQGITDTAAAYTTIQGLPSTAVPVVLDGKTFAPGVYSSAGGFTLSGGATVTLDAGGNPNAEFIFNGAGGAITFGAGSSVVLANCARAENVFWATQTASALSGPGTNFVGNMLVSGAVLTVSAGVNITGRLFANTLNFSSGITNIELPDPTTTVTMVNDCGTTASFTIALASSPTLIQASGTLLAGQSVVVPVPGGSPLTFVGNGVTLTLNPSTVVADQIVTFMTVGGVCTPVVANVLTITNDCSGPQPITVTQDGLVTLSCTIAVGQTISTPISPGAAAVTATGGTPPETIIIDPADPAPLFFEAGPGGTCVFAGGPGPDGLLAITNSCSTTAVVTVVAGGVTTVLTITPGETDTAPIPAGAAATVTYNGQTVVVPPGTAILDLGAAGLCTVVVAGITVPIVSGCPVTTSVDVTIVSGGVTRVTTVLVPAGGTVPLLGLLPGDTVTVTANGVTLGPITIVAGTTQPTIALLSGTCTPVLVVAPTGPAARVCCPRVFVRPLFIKKSCPLFIKKPCPLK